MGTVHFAKTKFLLHAGLAFGAFHRYIYKPFKNGILQASTGKKVVAALKGGAAALFAYHELKLAKTDAEANKTLCHLVAPLDALGGKLSGLGGSLKNGNVDPTAIESVNTDVTSLGSQSNSAGAGISDKSPPSF